MVSKLAREQLEIAALVSEGKALMAAACENALAGKMAAFGDEAATAFGPALWAHLHALDMVTVERIYQMQEYGWFQDIGQPDQWMRVLATELGEVGQEIKRFNEAEHHIYHGETAQHDEFVIEQYAAMRAASTAMLKEVIHVAAVATAWAEQLLRSGVIPPAERTTDGPGDTAGGFGDTHGGGASGQGGGGT